MPPKGPSKPKTFKYDGRLYLLPESGATALHELRPGDFIADLKSYNPVLANVEAKRIIIGQAFNTLLVAKCGSNTTQHARQIHDEWSRKLTDHLRSQRNKVNVKPQSQSIPPVVSGPGQRKKQKGNRQPSAIIGGQSWFIPDGNKFRLDQFSLLAFTKTFIDLNPARRIQDFASDLLIEACEVFVVSQYPTASAKKKKAALERRDSQAPKFLKSHDKRLRDAARVDERRTSAAVSQETKDARAKASSKAVTEESSDDTSSNTEGGRHDNCESSAGEQ
ncbi:MAG: hypothetical protein M1830_004767, partial [Pleopsidium flavum]